MIPIHALPLILKTTHPHPRREPDWVEFARQIQRDLVSAGHQHGAKIAGRVRLREIALAGMREASARIGEVREADEKTSSGVAVSDASRNGDLSLSSVVWASNSAINRGATIIWHPVRMPSEYDLTLRHVDQLRTDKSGLEVVT